MICLDGFMSGSLIMGYVVELVVSSRCSQMLTMGRARAREALGPSKYNCIPPFQRIFGRSKYEDVQCSL